MEFDFSHLNYTTFILRKSTRFFVFSIVISMFFLIGAFSFLYCTTFQVIFFFAANIHDTKSGILAAQKACEKYPSIEAFCADAGYRGTFVDEVKERLQRRVDISEKIRPHEWEKLPWRWIVERTFGWMNAARRLAKELEISVSIEDAMINISCEAVLLRRL